MPFLCKLSLNYSRYYIMRNAFLLFNLFFLFVSCGTNQSNTEQDSTASLFAKDTLTKGYYRDWSKLPKNKRQAVYERLCGRIDQQRSSFLKQWNSATSESQKQTVLNDSRAYLLRVMADSLLVCWYDTPWDFNGTSQKPGEGSIACGYFVTTTLQQAGFDVQRVWLAQQASSVLIRTLCAKKNTKTITNNQTVKLLEYMKLQEDGLFIIGLDTHTGYVVKQGNRLDFVHACYFSRKYVLREPVASSPILLDSKFYMIGNVLGTDETVITWLTKTPIRTQ